jgi:hypothetical protein
MVTHFYIPITVSTDFTSRRVCFGTHPRLLPTPLVRIRFAPLCRVRAYLLEYTRPPAPAKKKRSENPPTLRIGYLLATPFSISASGGSREGGKITETTLARFRVCRRPVPKRPMIGKKEKKRKYPPVKYVLDIGTRRDAHALHARSFRRHICTYFHPSTIGPHRCLQRGSPPASPNTAPTALTHPPDMPSAPPAAHPRRPHCNAPDPRSLSRSRHDTVNITRPVVPPCSRRPAPRPQGMNVDINRLTCPLF